MTTKRFAITAMIYDKKNKLLSVGRNSYVKTHPYQAKIASKVGEPYRIYLHAEIHAILKCPDLSKAHRIDVFRFNDDGSTGNSKPCPVCLEAIKLAGIKVINHT